MSYQYVFFDLDGTLTDSAEGILNCGRYALEQLGLPVPPESTMRKMIGPPLTTGFPILGVPAEQVEEAITLYRDKYNNRGGKYQNRVYDGIEEVLKDLKAEGYALYIATSKPEALAKDICKKFGLDGYFDYIAGATEDHSRETKTDVLRYLLELTGHKDGVVMVGDTDYDVIGAKNMGLPCIGVTWGFGSAASMEAAGAVGIATTMDELKELILE